MADSFLESPDLFAGKYIAANAFITTQDLEFKGIST